MQALQGWACCHCKREVHGTRDVPTLSLMALMFSAVASVWRGMLLHTPTSIDWAEQKESRSL